MKLKDDCRVFIGRAKLFALCLAVAAACVYASPARAITFYEDTETGQLFTKPGPGRVQIEGEVIIVRPESSEGGDKPEQPVDEEAVADKVLASLPSWVRNIDIKGDLRLRYDLQDTEGSEARHRGRYRYRMFVESPVTKNLFVSFMFASGSDDPKSANQTFGPSFQAPDFRIRQAYAQYNAFDWLFIRGGQMENVLWRPSDGIWDKDVKPTGGAIGLVYENESMFEPFMNSAIYLIECVKSSPKDPFMIVLQPGVDIELSDNVSLKLAGTYYEYQAVRGAAIAHSPGSNLTMGGLLVNDYDGIVGSGELKLGGLHDIVPQVKVFGEYAYNFDPDVLNQGFIAGFKFGSKKVVKQGTWEVMYSYRRMGRDAILDILPDSDAFSGRTNITGHEVAANVGVFDNVTFGVDYYKMRDITTNIDEDRLQLDFVYSFPGI